MKLREYIKMTQRINGHNDRKGLSDGRKSTLNKNSRKKPGENTDGYKAQIKHSV